MPPRRRFEREHNPFDQIAVFLPKQLARIVRETSERMGLPMSRLIGYAVDNELLAVQPFAFPCPLPMNTYVEHAYMEEAQRIYNYLLKFPNGLGRDQLVLCRHDLGIPNKETFLQGLRELFEREMIQEIKPPPRTKFVYPEGYKYIRLKKDVLHAHKIEEEKRHDTTTVKSVLDEA